jgi:uncharacterized protein DUF3592
LAGVLATVCTFSTIALFVVVTSWVERSDALIARSRAVEGHVIEFVSHHRRGSAVRVRYSVGGNERTTTVDLRSVPAVGGTVPLRYDPEHPVLAFDPLNEEPVPMPISAGLAFLLAALTFIALVSVGIVAAISRAARRTSD